MVKLELAENSVNLGDYIWVTCDLENPFQPKKSAERVKVQGIRCIPGTTKHHDPYWYLTVIVDRDGETAVGEVPAFYCFSTQGEANCSLARKQSSKSN